MYWLFIQCNLGEEISELNQELKEAFEVQMSKNHSLHLVLFDSFDVFFYHSVTLSYLIGYTLCGEECSPCSMKHASQYET